MQSVTQDEISLPSSSLCVLHIQGIELVCVLHLQGKQSLEYMDSNV